MASSANDRWVDDIDPSSDSLLPTLLPGQDNSAPPSPMSGASGFVASCGFRLSEVGLSEFRKPQVNIGLLNQRAPICVRVSLATSSVALVAALLKGLANKQIMGHHSVSSVPQGC